MSSPVSFPQALCAHTDCELVGVGEEHLDQVLAIENASYTHPWSRGNFADSLTTGYWFPGLVSKQQLLAYMVVMPGVDEAHLLNITVLPEQRGQGLAQWLLATLVVWATQRHFQWVWLEVRASNLNAQQLYRHFGFVQVGRRPNYYPTSDVTGCSREDALVMSYKI